MNTINPFSGHFLEKISKTFTRSVLFYPYEPELQNSEYVGHQVGLKYSGSQNFSSLGLGWAQISVNGGDGTGQTDFFSPFTFFFLNYSTTFGEHESNIQSIIKGRQNLPIS
jgi:hypothetical protein